MDYKKKKSSVKESEKFRAILKSDREAWRLANDFSLGIDVFVFFNKNRCFHFKLEKYYYWIIFLFLLFNGYTLFSVLYFFIGWIWLGIQKKILRNS